eukprot:tig00000430_g660.t1
MLQRARSTSPSNSSGYRCAGRAGCTAAGAFDAALPLRSGTGALCMPVLSPIKLAPLQLAVNSGRLAEFNLSSTCAASGAPADAAAVQAARACAAARTPRPAPSLRLMRTPRSLAPPSVRPAVLATLSDRRSCRLSTMSRARAAGAPPAPSRGRRQDASARPGAPGAREAAPPRLRPCSDGAVPPGRPLVVSEPRRVGYGFRLDQLFYARPPAWTRTRRPARPAPPAPLPLTLGPPTLTLGRPTQAAEKIKAVQTKAIWAGTGTSITSYLGPTRIAVGTWIKDSPMAQGLRRFALANFPDVSAMGESTVLACPRLAPIMVRLGTEREYAPAVPPTAQRRPDRRAPPLAVAGGCLLRALEALALGQWRAAPPPRRPAARSSNPAVPSRAATGGSRRRPAALFARGGPAVRFARGGASSPTRAASAGERPSSPLARPALIGGPLRRIGGRRGRVSRAKRQGLRPRSPNGRRGPRLGGGTAGGRTALRRAVPRPVPGHRLGGAAYPSRVCAPACPGTRRRRPTSAPLPLPRTAGWRPGRGSRPAASAGVVPLPRLPAPTPDSPAQASVRRRRSRALWGPLLLPSPRAGPGAEGAEGLFLNGGAGAGLLSAAAGGRAAVAQWRRHLASRLRPRLCTPSPAGRPEAPAARLHPLSATRNSERKYAPAVPLTAQRPPDRRAQPLAAAGGCLCGLGRAAPALQAPHRQAQGGPGGR